ncbi:MAG: hypothetical protein EXQ89_05320 [Rhodospirillaceae bacterium]|nr:hypothetical protein [Rhodospirillaceae bacterium]
MRFFLAIVAVLSVLGLAPPAKANCTTDITALKMRIDREKDAAKKGAALSQYAAALQAEQTRDLATCQTAVNKAKAKLK